MPMPGHRLCLLAVCQGVSTAYEGIVVCERFLAPPADPELMLSDAEERGRAARPGHSQLIWEHPELMLEGMPRRAGERHSGH
jgi:hypothetical protein